MDPEEIDLSDVSESELSSEWDSSDDEIVEAVDDLAVALQNAGISVPGGPDTEEAIPSNNNEDIELTEALDALAETEETDENYKPITKHEILPEEVEIDPIDVTLPENATFARAGRIVHILEDSIIIDAGKQAQPIEENTLIFTKNHQCIGRVFEIFGQVTEPMYLIRWPKTNPLDKSLLNSEDSLYYCDNITHYLIPSTLACPATDASNLFDEEPNENERKEIECTEDLPDGENDEYPRSLMMPSTLIPKHPVEMVLHPDYSKYKNCIIPPSVPAPHSKKANKNILNKNENKNPISLQNISSNQPTYKTTSLSSILSSCTTPPITSEQTEDTVMDVLPTVAMNINSSEESNSDIDLESELLESNPQASSTQNESSLSYLQKISTYQSDDDSD